MSAFLSSTGLPIDPLCCCCWTHLGLSVGSHQSGLEKSLPGLPFIFGLGGQEMPSNSTLLLWGVLQKQLKMHCTVGSPILESQTSLPSSYHL